MSDFSEEVIHEYMIGARVDEADPIWGTTASVFSSPLIGKVVQSSRGGRYAIAEKLIISTRVEPEKKAKISTWVTDQNNAGEEIAILSEKALQAISRNRPINFTAKVDRFFSYLNVWGHRLGDLILPDASLESSDTIAWKEVVIRWIEAVDDKELWGFMRALASAGLVSETFGRWTLTAEGLLRLEKLSVGGENSDQDFVAMWFNPAMDEVFDEGVEPALAEAGYKAIRIDRKEHSGKIDDEIIAEIRRSRFIVADFTCGLANTATGALAIPRGGVYYEAGFAQGLGLPVIWCVREDQIEMVHFDTRQFNHIVWKNAIDLRNKLYRRVAAVIGHNGNTVGVLPM